MPFFSRRSPQPDSYAERWRPREDRKLAKLAAKGLTAKQCADRLGRSEAGTRARAEHLGVTFTPNPVR